MPDETSQKLTLSLASEADTARLGQALGTVARPGLVVALIGDLGAGKTRLAQSVATGLGVAEDDVTSPTFVLIQEYEGRLPVYHFDAYRLRDTDEFLELGADEYLNGNGVCLIEWADRVTDVLPRDRVTVQLDVTGEQSRTALITARGVRSEEVVTALRRQLVDPSASSVPSSENAFD